MFIRVFICGPDSFLPPLRRQLDASPPNSGEFIRRDAAGHTIEADFRASWITDSDLERLAAMPDLRRIDLSHTRITDIGFEHLKKLEKVESVNLYYAELIGDGALAAMKDWKHLRELTLRGTKVTDAGLAHLANMRTLESLDIGFALITDGGFDALHCAAEPGSRSPIGGNKVSARRRPLTPTPPDSDTDRARSERRPAHRFRPLVGERNGCRPGCNRLADSARASEPARNQRERRRNGKASRISPVCGHSTLPKPG